MEKADDTDREGIADKHAADRNIAVGDGMDFVSDKFIRLSRACDGDCNLCTGLSGRRLSVRKAGGKKTVPLGSRIWGSVLFPPASPCSGNAGSRSRKRDSLQHWLFYQLEWTPAGAIDLLIRRNGRWNAKLVFS